MDRSLPLLGVLCILGLLVVAGSAGVAVGGATAQEAEPSDGQYLLELEASGDAEVVVSTELDLTDDDQRATFEQFEDEEYRESAAERFENDTRFVSEVANEQVDREMRIGEVTVEPTTSSGGEVGVVTYRFRWEALAAADDGRVTLSEPFSLYDELDRELVVVAPEGYELTSAAPDPEEHNETTASWPGFTPLEGFEVVAEEGVDGAVEDGWAIGDGAGPGAVLAAISLLAAGLVLAARRRRR